MASRLFSILKGARRHAVAWFRARTERVRILLAFVPSLSDAFNADDLPLSFILERDSRRANEPTSGRWRGSNEWCGTRSTTRPDRRVRGGRRSIGE